MVRYTGKIKFKRGTSFEEAYKDTVLENWDYSRNTIKPKEITYGNSRKKIYLICQENHSFLKTPYNIKLGQWCPTCSKENASERQRKALFKKERPFGLIYPQYVKYWSNKNELTPFEVMPGSDYSFLFNCKKGHEFLARISNIAYNKRWCPYCSNKKVNSENSFASKNPHLIKHWSHKNKKSPHEVTFGSDYQAWFECNCGNVWKSRCADINKGKWCMQCSNRPKITNENVDRFLKENNKSFTRVGDYQNARKPIYFLCHICNKLFKCSYDNMTRLDTGCSHCKQSKGEKEVARILDDLQISYKSQVTYEGLTGLNGGLLKFDFGLNFNNRVLLIEYDGEYHFEKLYENDNYERLVEHDKTKNRFCKENNIPLLRIPYWNYDDIRTLITERLKI